MWICGILCIPGKQVGELIDCVFINKLLLDSNMVPEVLSPSFLARGLQVHAEPGCSQSSRWLHLLCLQGSVRWVFFSLPSSYGRNFFFNFVPHRTQFHCPITCLFTSESPQSGSEEESEIVGRARYCTSDATQAWPDVLLLLGHAGSLVEKWAAQRDLGRAPVTLPWEKQTPSQSPMAHWNIQLTTFPFAFASPGLDSHFT